MPSSGRCSITTSPSGSCRTMSRSRRPGTTIAPSSAASSEARSESSMSVAARCSWPASARSSTPSSTWTAERVDTARATTPSFSPSSVRPTVAFSPDPTTMSVSIISLNSFVRSRRECGRRGRRCGTACPERLRCARPRGTTGGFEQGHWGRAKSSTGLANLLDPGSEFLHKVVHRAILANQARDLARRVDHGGVIAPAELLADLRQRRVGELAREVHRDLARVHDVLGALVAAELLEREPEAVGDGFLDPLDRDGGELALWEDISKHVLREVDRHRPAGERRE